MEKKKQFHLWLQFCKIFPILINNIGHNNCLCLFIMCTDIFKYTIHISCMVSKTPGWHFRFFLATWCSSTLSFVLSLYLFCRQLCLFDMVLRLVSNIKNDLKILKKLVLFGAFFLCKVSNSILLASSPDHLPVLLLPRGAHLHHHHPHPQDRAHDRLYPGLQ